MLFNSLLVFWSSDDSYVVACFFQAVTKQDAWQNIA